MNDSQNNLETLIVIQLGDYRYFSDEIRVTITPNHLGLANLKG